MTWTRSMSSLSLDTARLSVAAMSAVLGLWLAHQSLDLMGSGGAKGRGVRDRRGGEQNLGAQYCAKGGAFAHTSTVQPVAVAVGISQVRAGKGAWWEPVAGQVVEALVQPVAGRGGCAHGLAPELAAVGGYRRGALPQRV